MREIGDRFAGQFSRPADSDTVGAIGDVLAANYRAACIAQSKAAFASKMSLVVEEADESAFWMEFIIEEGLLTRTRVAALLQEARELTSICIASRKTARSSLG